MQLGYTLQLQDLGGGDLIQEVRTLVMYRSTNVQWKMLVLEEMSTFLVGLMSMKTLVANAMLDTTNQVRFVLHVRSATFTKAQVAFHVQVHQLLGVLLVLCLQ